jgi:membrane associated rhomboid family serine protease
LVICSICGQELSYLPFTCRNCRKSFCSTHRLPENHFCTMEFSKQVQKTQQKKKGNAVKVPFNSASCSGSGSCGAGASDSSGFLNSSNFSNFSNSSYNVTPTNKKLYKLKSIKGITWILVLNIIFLILGLIPVLVPYVYVSLGVIMQEPYLFYTIFTSMFVPGFSLSTFGIISLVINFLFLLWIGKMIEDQFGKKRVLSIYLGGTLITSISIIAMQSIFLPFPPYDIFIYYMFYASWGGTMAILAFWARLNPDREVRLLLYFIPIRMKMKHMLLIMIGFELIPAIISLSDLFSLDVYLLLLYSPDFIVYFANILGIVSGYVNSRSVRRY